MRISDWSSDVCSSDLPCGDVQLKVPPNGGRIENGQQKFLARLYGKGKSGKNGISAGWDRILLSMLVGPATPRSEEHTSELQSLMRISYAVFCLKKKTDI